MLTKYVILSFTVIPFLKSFILRVLNGFSAMYRESWWDLSLDLSSGSNFLLITTSEGGFTKSSLSDSHSPTSILPNCLVMPESYYVAADPKDYPTARIGSLNCPPCWDWYRRPKWDCRDKCLWGALVQHGHYSNRNQNIIPPYLLNIWIYWKRCAEGLIFDWLIDRQIIFDPRSGYDQTIKPSALGASFSNSNTSRAWLAATSEFWSNPHPSGLLFPSFGEFNLLLLNGRHLYGNQTSYFFNNWYYSTSDASHRHYSSL